MKYLLILFLLIGLCYPRDTLLVKPSTITKGQRIQATDVGNLYDFINDSLHTVIKDTSNSLISDSLLSLKNKVIGNTTSSGIDSVGIYNHLKNLKHYSIADYGIDTTGTNDISTKFFELINTILPDSSVLIFPKGHYKISSGDTIKKSIYLKGSGIGQSIIDCDNGTNIFYIGENFVCDGFTFINAEDLFKIRYLAWQRDTLDYLIINNCLFENIISPMETSNLYDSSHFIKSVIISNNIVENCCRGFQFSTKFQTLSFINNHFTNMINTTTGGVNDTISFAIFAGAPTREMNSGIVNIIGNNIDSLYATGGDEEHNGIFVYGHRVNVIGNNLSRFGCSSDALRGISGMYLSGYYITCIANNFYNVSFSNYADKSQDIWTKGADVDNQSIMHIIGLNNFYSNRDSAGYSIYTQSPAHIIGNEFRYIGSSLSVDMGLRLGTSGDWFDDKDKIFVVSENKIYSERDFLKFSPVTEISVTNNTAYIHRSKKLIEPSSSGFIDILNVNKNRLFGGMLFQSLYATISQFELHNNYCLSDTLIINFTNPNNVNSSHNAFILDTMATIGSPPIKLYTVNQNAVVSWSNNLHIERNTLSSAQPFIYTGGGWWFSDNNKFIMDSCATPGSNAWCYRFQTSTNYIEINNDKFLTTGTKLWTYVSYIIAGTYPHIKITNCLFDNYITTGIRNFGTVAEFDLSGNDWNGTTFFTQSGTCALMARNQNWGDGIYFLNEYVDSDSLYRIIYDFNNTLQDTIGIKR